MIQVTKTFLPPFDEYIAQLKRAWDRAWITNNGILVTELEDKLKAYLGVKNLLFCSNGTIVLQMALKVLGIEKEVITTPFSYVATANAILWEKCQPVFVDINHTDFCIDVTKIEASITENTQAILVTHVFGNPCEIDSIQKIASKYNLKIIYDGAHSFGTVYNNKQLLSYGDISTCSFHATKLFHTVEGGCIIAKDDDLYEKLKLMRSFGHVGDQYYSLGINGKNSEFHAAMGLTNLPHLEQIIKNRTQISKRYDLLLSNSNLSHPVAIDNTVYNYSYYPVIFPNEEIMLLVKNKLELNNILTRRYFYPSLNNLPYLESYSKCSTSENIASRILCLPLYDSLTFDEVENICKIILSVIN